MNIKCPYCHSLQHTKGLNELVCEECNNTIYIFSHNDYKIISYTTLSAFELAFYALSMPVFLLAFFVIFYKSSNNLEGALLYSGIIGLGHPISYKFSGGYSITKSYFEVLFALNMNELKTPKKIQFISSLVTLGLGLISLVIYFIL